MKPAIGGKPVLSEPRRLDTSAWRLNLIKNQGGSWVAMINGKLVRVGSRVDRALVRSIDARQVVLQIANARTIKLQLPSARLRRSGR